MSRPSGYGAVPQRTRSAPDTRDLNTDSDIWPWGVGPDSESESGEERSSIRRTRSDESRQLLPSDQAPPQPKPGNQTAAGAALLLLKSFVGTGVLFLPHAFLYGGLLFSSIALAVISALTMVCFLILLDTQERVGGLLMYERIGKHLFGNRFLRLINFSILISQLGFSCAYVVFTSENMRAVAVSLFGDRYEYPLWVFVFIQVVVLIPASLLRPFEGLRKLAVPGNVLIGLAIVGVYYYNFKHLIAIGPATDLKMFSGDTWPLFVGTAIFTFEGIGLLLPIKQKMKKPEQFKGVLSAVMIFITLLFASVGAMSYAAYGGETKMVLLLNLPSGSWAVVVMQLVYCVAIILSTPLQFYPVINITSKAIFPRSFSGRRNPVAKMVKNLLRTVLVLTMVTFAWLGSSRLDKFVSFVGSFACIPLVFIYPPVMHLKLPNTERWSVYVMDWFLIAFGLSMMIYTTYLSISG